MITNPVTFNTLNYIQEFYKIKDKNSQLIPFILNPPQLKLYNVVKQLHIDKKPIRIIILKARQIGYSTIVEGIGSKRAMTERNVNFTVIAHDDKSTSSLFEMSKRFYDNLPGYMQPSKMADNGYEMTFNTPNKNGLDSKIQCMTPGGRGVGRSKTINILHISEYGYWPGDKAATIAGILAAVPSTPDSIVVIESTANGYDDFKSRWDKAVDGESDYIPIFTAWFELEEYRMNAADLILNDNVLLYGNEKEIMDRYNLDMEQMAWRRWTIRNICNNDLNMFKQEYPCNPEEAFISSGNSVFNNELVVAQIERIRHNKPLHTGYFEYKKEFGEFKNTISDIKWVENHDIGYIKLHANPEVKLKNDIITGKKPYVIGGDTAGVGEDYFTAKVIDNITKQTVATLWKQSIDEDLYADQLYCLGKHYHNALIAIETNYSTQPTRELEKCEYPNMYVRDRMDTLTNKIVKAYGFETNTKTRPVMIADLVALMRLDPTLEVDIPTLKEMLTFIKDGRGKAQASENEHDDLVMALAIAHFISGKQISTWIQIEQKTSDFIKENFSIETEKSGGYEEW